MKKPRFARQIGTADEMQKKGKEAKVCECRRVVIIGGSS